MVRISLVIYERHTVIMHLWKLFMGTFVRIGLGLWGHFLVPRDQNRYIPTCEDRKRKRHRHSSDEFSTHLTWFSEIFSLNHVCDIHTELSQFSKIMATLHSHNHIMGTRTCYFSLFQCSKQINQQNSVFTIPRRPIHAVRHNSMIFSLNHLYTLN